MIVIILAAVAAVQATPPPAPGTATTATAQAPAAKPKRKHKTCATGEPEVGSHIVMDTCPTDIDEYEAARRAHQTEQAVTFYGVPVDKPGATGPH